MKLQDDANRSECLRQLESVVESATEVLRRTEHRFRISDDEYTVRALIALRFDVEQALGYLGYTPTPAADARVSAARDIAAQIEAGGSGTPYD